MKQKEDKRLFKSDILILLNNQKSKHLDILIS